MKDERKTKKQLIAELVELRSRLAEARRPVAALGATEAERVLEKEVGIAYDALSSAVGGIIITDHKGKIEYANPAFFRMFG
ncbi:MAG: PAS domain-containing protein, partial [Chloroflexi bacterium]|nr:PAS domain-containing protein [Chloroflexota bacterium]